MVPCCACVVGRGAKWAAVRLGFWKGCFAQNICPGCRKLRLEQEAPYACVNHHAARQSSFNESWGPHHCGLTWADELNDESSEGLPPHLPAGVPATGGGRPRASPHWDWALARGMCRPCVPHWRRLGATGGPQPTRVHARHLGVRTTQKHWPGQHADPAQRRRCLLATRPAACGHRRAQWGQLGGSMLATSETGVSPRRERPHHRDPVSLVVPPLHNARIHPMKSPPSCARPHRPTHLYASSPPPSIQTTRRRPTTVRQQRGYHGQL